MATVPEKKSIATPAPESTGMFRGVMREALVSVATSGALLPRNQLEAVISQAEAAIIPKITQGMNDSLNNLGKEAPREPNFPLPTNIPPEPDTEERATQKSPSPSDTPSPTDANPLPASPAPTSKQPAAETPKTENNALDPNQTPGRDSANDGGVPGGAANQEEQSPNRRADTDSSQPAPDEENQNRDEGNVSPQRNAALQLANRVRYGSQIKKIDTDTKKIAKENETLRREIKKLEKKLAPLEHAKTIATTLVRALHVTIAILAIVTVLLVVTIVFIEGAGGTTAAISYIWRVAIPPIKQKIHQLDKDMAPGKKALAEKKKKRGANVKKIQQLARARHAYINNGLLQQPQPNANTATQ